MFNVHYVKENGRGLIAVKRGGKVWFDSGTRQQLRAALCSICTASKRGVIVK